MYIFAHQPLAIFFASFVARCRAGWRAFVTYDPRATQRWVDEQLADVKGMIADCERARDEHERATTEFKVARAQYDLEKEHLRELCNLGLCKMKAVVEMHWFRN